MTIDNLKPDILFLDVQINEIDAFATIEASEHNPIIIIMSSHWETENKLIEPEDNLHEFLSFYN